MPDWRFPEDDKPEPPRAWRIQPQGLVTRSFSITVDDDKNRGGFSISFKHKDEIVQAYFDPAGRMSHARIVRENGWEAEGSMAPPRPQFGAVSK
jgi:hypothetical protein